MFTVKTISLLTFALILSLTTACKKTDKGQATVIFDFDLTILSSPYSVVIETLAYGDSHLSHEEIIKKINSEIELRQKRGDKYPLFDIINTSSDEIGVIVNKSTIPKAIKALENSLTPQIGNIIKDLIKSGANVFVIGGGYIACDIMAGLLLPLGIPKQNIFSGKTSFNQNNKSLLISEKERGYANCATGKILTPVNWSKSSVIANLKKGGKIKGKIIHIGDGQNDLEVWKANQADHFIGFGINKIDEVVKKEADIFVDNINDFRKIVFNLIEKK